MSQLPNFLTVSRILLTVLFVYLISRGNLAGVVAATLIFVLATLTDYYDGYFAKRQNSTSNFGIIMDPIADKILILVAFFIFVRLGFLEGWMFLLIFGREIFITAFRLLAIHKGRFLPAEKAGKCKTVSQVVAILLILATIIFRESGSIRNWDGQLVIGWGAVVMLSVWVAVAMTVISGVLYLWHNRRWMYAP